ncbi:LacI family DNA-binding transcriptional regulator [uncultured Roseobacter sp.]|uniref:LacI family DNA-binding transcriptional regulator n=1 Tax=uncultured Roseobacter sp. TaxID=114847 RepID=UPI00262CA4AC|nr:LacI family DNA-binding transcriptional regulator [uncultured Roseobacter sp.]
MAGKPKLETVAREAGVSIATASQVMRGAGRISDKTRTKVLKAAQKLHYVPDNRAASMRSGQNREIGFVINKISNPFNAEVISGVSDLLEADGYLVSVLDARDDPERQGRHIDAFIRNGRGGLLWVPAEQTPQKTFELLAAHRIPTVTFLRRPQASGFDHVGIRNAEATAQATNHLADLGHRHIAYLGGEELTAVRRERIAGYQTVMAERALGTPVIWDSNDIKLAGMQAMMALRAAHPETTAVVCNGDIVALGACHGIRRMGLQPGKEISVVGFDDIPDAAVATPPLTTMAVSPYQLGRRLARVMLERLSEPTGPASVSEVSAELVLRATTGPI